MKLTTLIKSGLILAALNLFAGTGLAQKTFESPKYGFKIKPPQGWQPIPLQTNEKWIAAKYLCPKKYVYAKTSFAHKPVMTVIVFPESRKKVKKKKLVDEEKLKITLIENPYKDYLDYMDKNFSGGGWHVAEEKETTVKGNEVIQRVISVERGTDFGSGKKTIVCWVYKLEGVDVAVQFEILSGSYDKEKSNFQNSLKSLRAIERLPEAPTTGSDSTELDNITSVWMLNLIEKDDEPAEDRKARRIAFQEKQHKKAVDNLPKDWKTDRSDHYLILSNVDAAFNKKVANQAEAIYSFLDKNFGDLTDDYVMHGIIRVCATFEELEAFTSLSGSGFSTSASSSNEVAICRKNQREVGGGSITNKWEESLSRGLVSQYFERKNSLLYSNMPLWFRTGLRSYLSEAKVSGRKLKFSKPDEYERMAMRQAEKKGELVALRDLFEDPRWATSGDVYYAQTTSVIRYLMTKGNKKKKTKGLVRKYIETMNQVVDEKRKQDDKEDKGKKSKKDQTEEEQEAEAKAKREAWKKRREAILKETARRVFLGWKTKDWTNLEKAWRKEAL